MTGTDHNVMANRAPARIVIAQTTYLGDLLLTLPLALRIHEAFPESMIAMIVRPEHAPIARACPAVSRVHVMEKESGHPTLAGLRALAREVRLGAYDAAITMPGSIRTAALMVLAGIPRRIGWYPGDHLTSEVNAVRHPAGMLRVRDVRRILAFETLYRWSAPVRAVLPPLFTDELHPRQGMHRAGAALDALVAIGAPPSTVSPPPWLTLPPEAGDEVDRLLPEVTPGWVVIAPGATQQTRRWPIEHLAEFVRLLVRAGHTAVVIGAEGERETGERILAAAGNARVHQLAGRASLLATCEIVRRAGVVIANDSAPIHIASAMGTPVVALFGPTLPSFGFAPLADRSTVIERSGLVCRPCTVYGGPVCPIGTHECMEAITPQEVFAAALVILDRPAPPSQGKGSTR
jgi:heptosyltransferase II